MRRLTSLILLTLIPAFGLSQSAQAQTPPKADSTATAATAEKPAADKAGDQAKAQETQSSAPATATTEHMNPAPVDQAPAVQAQQIDVEALKAQLKDELRKEMKGEMQRMQQEVAVDTQAKNSWKEENWVEEVKPKLNFLEFDGYLRTRMDLFQNLHLGTYDGAAPVDGNDPSQGTRVRATSSVPPPTLYRSNADNTNTLTSANMRLRVQPILNISEDIKVHATIDVFDNLVLGSTPESLPGFTGNPTLPLPAFTGGMSTPQAGLNGLSDSIKVRRAWAEVMTPFGQLRFGRMPSHFGLGLLSNSGNELDSDYGDSADRVMFVTRLYGHYIIPAWDFTATGPAGRLGGDGTMRAQTNEGGQWIDLDPRDDVKSWILAVAKKDKQADIDDKLANDGWVLNYGGYFVYRTQSYDQPQWYMSPSFPYGEQPSSEPSMYVVRDANAFILSTWGMFQWRKLKIEAEAVGIYGSIGNMSTSGGISDRDAYADPVTIMQYGFALESSYKFLHDALVVGFDAGMASGDDAPGFGLRPAARGTKNPEPGDFDGRQYGGCLALADDGSCASYDVDISNFKFDPDYHVDLILFREVLGTVTDAIYLKPHISYKITDGLGIKGALVQSFAEFASSTPGNSNLLGTEADLHLYYQSEDGYYAGLAYGALFPWQGLSHRSEVALSDESLRDAKFAHTVQGIFAVQF